MNEVALSNLLLICEHFDNNIENTYDVILYEVMIDEKGIISR